jgi:hypothetical protein
MITRDADERRFFNQTLDVQPSRRFPIDRSNDPHIEPMHRERLELRRWDHLGKSNFNIRVLLAKTLQNERHPFMTLGANEADCQVPSLREADSACLPNNLIEVEHDLLGAAQEGAACAGQLHAAAISFNQHYADSVFQEPDLSTDRRLRDMKHRSGAGEAQFLGNGNEVAQMTNFHFSNSAL